MTDVTLLPIEKQIDRMALVTEMELEAKRAPPPDDAPALEVYACAVLSGEIIACRRVRQVCAVLLHKLRHPEKHAPYVFDREEAERHVAFIETFCRQPQGRLGEPLRLELFQRARLEAAFGFIDSETGCRQYNEVLTIEGRKNGKTTECAAVEIDLLVNDGEGSPEIYNIATKREQAAKAYKACVQMRQQSPDLWEIKKRQSDLYFPYNMGFITVLASNTNSLDGLNSHGVVIDELAAIKKRSIYDDMKQSMSARDQPLLFCITTNGFVRECIFDEQYKYACGVLDGTIDDPHFLPFVYELDEREEWQDERMWIKANPGLGTIKKLSFLRQMVKKAKADSSFLPTLLVKDFNLKENAASAWLRYEHVSNSDTFDIKVFDYCIGGFDAADSIDLNAATAICMRPGDPKIYRRSMYWIPQAVLDQDARNGNLLERDGVPYRLWVDRGLMRTCPGNKVNKAVFLDWFTELQEEGLYVLYIGYDPWHIDDSLLLRFQQQFGERTMIPVRQGVKTLSQPMFDLKADLEEHKIVDNNHPIDKWCLLNMNVKTDINGNIQPIKGLDTRCRIDGGIALICAYKVLQDKMDEYVPMNKGVDENEPA